MNRVCVGSCEGGWLKVRWWFSSSMKCHFMFQFVCFYHFYISAELFRNAAFGTTTHVQPTSTCPASPSHPRSVHGF